MKKLILQRLVSDDSGTRGILDLSGKKLHTIELPKRENQHGLSCIDAGAYTGYPSLMPHFNRPMYLLEDVPNRNGIFIHPGNFAGDKTKGLRCDFEGCIGLGLAEDEVDGQKIITQSRHAIEEFMLYMNGEDLYLEILDCVS